GSGGFFGTPDIPVPHGYLPLAVGDFNGDGRPDLAVGGGSAVTLLFNGFPWPSPTPQPMPQPVPAPEPAPSNPPVINVTSGFGVRRRFIQQGQHWSFRLTLTNFSGQTLKDLKAVIVPLGHKTKLLHPHGFSSTLLPGLPFEYVLPSTLAPGQSTSL